MQNDPLIKQTKQAQSAKLDKQSKQTNPPKRFRWWHIYFVFLVASWITQGLILPSNITQPQNIKTVTLPTQTATSQIALPTAPSPSSPTETQPAEPPITLAYIESGRTNAPPLILLHGSPGDATNFKYLANYLDKTYRVIAVDLPGFGHSSKWIADYSNRAHARYIIALMQKLKINTADLFAFSMGAGVAYNIADIAPEKVKSITTYGGIGIQKGEGSGSYLFEHFKYILGYGLLVVAPEALPHFGLLGKLSTRHSFIQNFIDTDQRPLEKIIAHLTCPLLILHGKNDPMVPIWTARKHHQLVSHSKLVVYDQSHFMLFNRDKSKLLADDFQAFQQRQTNPATYRVRHTTDPFANADVENKQLGQTTFHINRQMSVSAQVAAIILGTFILEDPTTITTGILIRRGQLDAFVGIVAIFIGIFLGDLGLYALGFMFGRTALNWPIIASRMPTHHMNSLGKWFDQHGWLAVFASRFIPGTRFPLYVSAGALGRKPWRFTLWTFMAVLIWAPTMLLLVVFFEQAAESPFHLIFGDHWFSLVATLVLLIIMLRILTRCLTRIGRAKLMASFSRLWRWEFWPAWLFYLPIAPRFAMLTLRHRGITTLTAVNPGIEHSGFVGESKIDILNQLPKEDIIPSAFLVADREDNRLEKLKAIMAEHQWTWPLILKPNAGQRGYAVKKVCDEKQAYDYFIQNPTDLLVQTYHGGPYEAGIFYIRHPHKKTGKIFSITDKHFPKIIGDGIHTVEELVWQHSRYRMQADLFIKRHHEDRYRVLDDGENFKLAVSGNHCQGTMFRDGAHLITPELEKKIDQISKHFDGFYFGRFDIRYTSVQKLMDAQEMAIIELNGVTSESTNIYDPDFGLANAYRTLIQQWQWAYRIGHWNKKHGVPTSTWRSLFKTIRLHYKRRRGPKIAD